MDDWNEYLLGPKPNAAAETVEPVKCDREKTRDEDDVCPRHRFREFVLPTDRHISGFSRAFSEVDTTIDWSRART